MTIDEAIAESDDLRYNDYSREQKLLWLSRCEAMIKKTVIGCCEGGEEARFSGFSGDAPGETVLSMQEPYDEGYVHWLQAQIHYANEEIDRYNRSITMFNAALDGFKAAYIKEHMPIGKGRLLF